MWWMGQIYPSIDDASPHVAHSLRGPDNGGSGVFWTVGRNEMDAAERDAAYDLVMSCPHAAPVLDEDGSKWRTW